MEDELNKYTNYWKKETKQYMKQNVDNNNLSYFLSTTLALSREDAN